MNACILQTYEKQNMKILIPGVRHRELIFLTEMRKRRIRRCPESGEFWASVRLSLV